MRAQEDSDDEPEVDPTVPQILVNEAGTEVIVAFEGQFATIPGATLAHDYTPLEVSGKGWMVHAKGSAAGKSYWIAKLFKNSKPADTTAGDDSSAPTGAGTTGDSSASTGAGAATAVGGASGNGQASASEGTAAGSGGASASATAPASTATTTSCASTSATPAANTPTPGASSISAVTGLRPSSPQPAAKKPKTDGSDKSKSSKS